MEFELNKEWSIETDAHNIILKKKIPSKTKEGEKTFRYEERFFSSIKGLMRGCVEEGIKDTTKIEDLWKTEMRLKRLIKNTPDGLGKKFIGLIVQRLKNQD